VALCVAFGILEARDGEPVKDDAGQPRSHTTLELSATLEGYKPYHAQLALPMSNPNLQFALMPEEGETARQRAEVPGPRGNLPTESRSNELSDIARALFPPEKADLLNEAFAALGLRRPAELLALGEELPRLAHDLDLSPSELELLLARARAASDQEPARPNGTAQLATGRPESNRPATQEPPASGDLGSGLAGQQVYIAPFGGDTDEREKRLLATTVQEVLVNLAHANGTTKEDLEQLLQQEEHKERLECNTESCIHEIIENFGIAIAVFGTVTRLSPEECVVDIKVFDRSEPRWTGSRDSRCAPASLRDTVREMSESLCRKLSSEGVVQP